MVKRLSADRSPISTGAECIASWLVSRNSNVVKVLGLDSEYLLCEECFFFPREETSKGLERVKQITGRFFH